MVIRMYNIFYCTGNEYDLPPACNANGFLGVIIDLSQVFLAIYDTNARPFTCTGSEDIVIFG